MRKRKQDIRSVAYSWFESYLKERKQYVSVNGFSSKVLTISHSFHKVLFLSYYYFYTNYLHIAIKFCKVHHLDDDTNLQHIGNSIKKLNKFVNFDLKNFSD